MSTWEPHEGFFISYGNDQHTYIDHFGTSGNQLCILYCFSFWLSLSLSWFLEEVRSRKGVFATAKIFLFTIGLKKTFLLFRLLQVTISDNVHLNKEYSQLSSISFLHFSAWSRHVHQRDPMGQEQHNYVSFFILLMELPSNSVCQIGLSMVIGYIPKESQTLRRHLDGPYQFLNYSVGECLQIYSSVTPTDSGSKGKHDKAWNF